jgi:polysaccharide pyruvyl transferase WcaK-like protein
VGCSSDKIISIPDPALYVPTRPESWHPELDSEKTNLVLSLNNEDDQYRFGRQQPVGIWQQLRALTLKKEEPGLRKKKRFLQGLAQALETFAKDHDVNVILCIHSHEDYSITGEFINLCPPRFQTQMLVSRGQPRIAQTDYFYDLYAQADIALSMRVHSMSPAVGLGTPMAALVSQQRMTDFMADAGLADFCLDIFDSDFAEKLCARLTFLHDNRGQVRKRLQDASRRLRERTRAFNKRMAALLARPVGAMPLRATA